MTQHITTESDASADTVDREAVEGFFKVLADAWAKYDSAAVADSFADDSSLLEPLRRSPMGDPPSPPGIRLTACMLRGTTTDIQVEKIRPIDADHAFVDACQTISGSDGRGRSVAGTLSSPRPDHGSDGWRFVDARPYISQLTRPD